MNKIEWKEKIKLVVHAMLLFLCFLILHPFLDQLLKTYWVDKILVLFRPNLLFDSIFLLVVAFITYSHRSKNITSFDLFLLAVYVDFRFSDSWEFWKIFKELKFNHYLAYIDAIPIFYITNWSLFWINAYHLNKEKDKFAYGFLYPDLPLEKMKEIGSEHTDSFNRRKFAGQLAASIHQIIPYKAFAIGVCGEWGSGKTSLIDLVKEELLKSDQKKKYLFVEYSPWFFKDSESLFGHFFDLLESKFSLTNKGLAKEIKQYGKQIAATEKMIFKTQISTIFSNDPPSMNERYRRIKDQIIETGKTLVITIDDLDRLGKDEVVDVLRLIRVIADFPMTFYLVGYDKGYINSAIREKLTTYQWESYIDKVFNIEFEIPALTQKVTQRRLKELLIGTIDKMKSSLKRFNQSELDKCFSFTNIGQYLNNERDIRRFINNLMMRYITIKDEVNFYHFFLLELIHYKFPSEYRRFYDNREAFIHDRLEVNEITIDTSPAFVKLFNALYQSVDVNDDYSIKNELYFFRYFSLDLLDSDFTVADFTDALSLPPDEWKKRLLSFDTQNSPLLLEKLDEQFGRSGISDKEQFEKVIDGLLSLFYSINRFNKRREKNEVNNVQLSKLIIDMIRKSDLVPAKSKLSWLNSMVVKGKYNEELDMAELFAPENTPLFEISQNSSDIQSSRIGCLDILKDSLAIAIINNIPNSFNVFRQIMLIHRLMTSRPDGTYDEAGGHWFIEKIYTRHKEYITSHLSELSAWVLRAAVSDGEIFQDHVKNYMDGIFHSPSTLGGIPDSNLHLIDRRIMQIYLND